MGRIGSEGDLYCRNGFDDTEASGGIHDHFFFPAPAGHRTGRMHPFKTPVSAFMEMVAVTGLLVKDPLCIGDPGARIKPPVEEKAGREPPGSSLCKAGFSWLGRFYPIMCLTSVLPDPVPAETRPL